MSAHSHTAATAHAHEDHDAKAPRLYALILVVLLILTAITVSASYIQFGSGLINVIVALTIATIKATLVALFFMHLLHDKPMNALILVGSFLFLGIFLMFCYTDATTREAWTPSNLKSPAVTVPKAPTGTGAEHR